jgi:molecular chaperone GrpE (heat shock protein)
MVEPQPDNYSEGPELPASDAGDKADHLSVCHPTSEPGPVAEHPHDGPRATVSFQQSLRPILQGIEAVARAQFEQVDVLDRVEKVMMHQTAVPKILSETKQALESRNQVNRAMFEALHAELKTYKDAFVLEAVLRPVIRDLISLYDDISEIHRQLTLALTKHEERGNFVGSALILFENVMAPTNQLEHNRDSILEVLERLDVSLLPIGSGKLDKQSQRAVKVEATEDPGEDQEIIRVVKRGFMWKERIIRPEEVIIKKWKEGNIPATPKETGRS